MELLQHSWGRRRGAYRNGIGKKEASLGLGDDAGDLVKVAEKGRSQTVFMTKADLIAVIADKLKFPWARAEMLVDVVFGCLEQSMSRGEKIEIRATHPNYPYTREFLLVKERLSPRTSWANGATRRKFDIMRIPRMSLT